MSDAETRRAARRAERAERLNLKEQDDPLAEERRAWREKRLAAGGVSASSSSSGGDVDGQEFMSEEDRVLEHGRQLQRENAQSLKNSLKHAKEATNVGAGTIVQLQQQTEQMERMEHNLDVTHDSLSRSERIIKGMKSIGGTISNWFTSKPKAKAKDLTEKVREDPPMLEEKSEKSRSSRSRSNNKQDDDLPPIQVLDRNGEVVKNSRIEPNAKQQAALQEFAQNQKQEDEALDELSDTLHILKQQAHVMNKEMQTQDKLLDRIDGKVDSANERMVKATKTMSKIT